MSKTAKISKVTVIIKKYIRYNLECTFYKRLNISELITINLVLVFKNHKKSKKNYRRSRRNKMLNNKNQIRNT
jgi:hypothetical protein